VRTARRRTLALRALLALALLAALAGAFLAARSEDVRAAPLVPEGRTGIVVLDISASTSEAAFAQTIDKLTRGDERVGLIVFSDTAYELLPPGTPSRELVPLLRYFLPGEDGSPPPARNPWDAFRAGTRISEGLRLAGEVFEREGVTDGSILLISDFEILPDEIDRVARRVAELRGAGVDIRLVPLNPNPDRRARMNAILGRPAILRDETPEAEVRPPEADSLAAVAPWAFVGVAVLLVGLLSVNEALLARVEARR
jgi:hypothetical protein